MIATVQTNWYANLYLSFQASLSKFFFKVFHHQRIPLQPNIFQTVHVDFLI